MHRDRFDQPVSTSSACAAALNDDAVDRLFALQNGAAALIDEALALDPDFALAHCTKARVLLQQGDTAASRQWAMRGRDLAAGLPARERAHAEVVCLAIHGESTALQAVRDHATAYPRDAVPLSFAVGVYGLLGFGGFNDFHEQQVALLERVSPAWGEGAQDWWFLASLGWAYVEVGRADAGIALLERSLALNPDNANAVHGRAHGYYEQGAAVEGEAFIDAWLPGYDRSAVLHGHLAWHQALFALQRGDAERALGIYRDAVSPAASSALPLFTMIDAASFAVRSDTYGHPLTVDERRQIADFAAKHFPKAGVPFANVHLAMAYACAGEREAQEALKSKVATLLDDGRQPSGPVVARLCDAVAAYAGGDYASAAALLDEAAPESARLGGSHAQRDVLIDLAIAAHLRANAALKARATAQRRWTQRAKHLDEAWLRRMARAARST